MVGIGCNTQFLHRSEDEPESESVLVEAESDEPVYKVSPDKYSAEDMVRILLNPNIDHAMICMKRPFSISTSSSYVVDLDSLQHTDNFGVWTYSGFFDLIIIIVIIINVITISFRCIINNYY